MSQMFGISRLNPAIKVSPNFLTLPEGPSSGQKVGDSDFALFFHPWRPQDLKCYVAAHQRHALAQAIQPSVRHEDKYWKLLRTSGKTTPVMCDSVHCLLAILCTTTLNYSGLFVTTPRFFIFSQRALAQKWSSFPSKSKYIIL